MKQLIFLIPLCLTSAHAATVAVVNPVPNSTFRQVNGSFISPSSAVRIGFFTGAVEFNCDTHPAALSNFVPLGEPSSLPGYGTPAGNSLQVSNGMISGGINDITFGTGTPNTIQDGFVARGTRFYLLVIDQGEFGAFSATTWNVPNSNFVNMMTLNPQQVDTPAEVFWGQFGGSTLYLSGLCPEPGVSGLCLLGGALALTCRPPGRRAGASR